MHLDTVEARRQRILRGLRVGGHQPRQLGGIQRARRDKVFHALPGEGLPGRLDRRRRDRQLAVRLQVGMRNPAHVPQLQGDLAAGAMHGLGHPLPAGDLRLAMDARRARIAVRLGTDRRRLGEDQTGAGALPVILGHQRRGHVARPRAIARQRRHHDAVSQLDGAEAGR